MTAFYTTSLKPKVSLTGFLMAILLLTGAASLRAQTITIGSTGNPTEYHPIYTYYGNNYGQMIYLASEVTAAGATGPAYISAISFYYANPGLPTNAWENWEVLMGNTSKTAFSNGNDWVTGLSAVFSGTVAAPASAGQWMTIALSTPFLWDGASNIVVGVHENSPGYTNGGTDNAQWASNASNDKRSIVFYDDNTDPDPASPPAAMQQSYSYPSVKFALTALAACAGTPSPAITVSTNTSVCANTPFTLSLSGGPLASGLSYQWQSSPNGTSWTNMGASQGNSPYGISNQSTTTYYRCITTCVASAASSTSTPVSVVQRSTINCFCTAPSLDCDNGYSLDNISFSNLSSYSPTCTPGGNSYQDLVGVAPTISVTAGQAYTLTATTNQSGSFIFGSWIDYNNSGSFDSWEYTALASGTNTGVQTATVTIPFTSQPGSVRMRLSLEDGSAVQDPCNTIANNGQVLDFEVHITALPGCAGTPTAGAAVSTSTSVCSNTPYTLDLTGVSAASGMSFQWQSSPNGSSWTNLGSIQYHTPYVVSTQSATTYYRCLVTCTGSAATATSSPVTVNQSSFLLCYCNPGSVSCNSTYFTDVNFAGISSSSITCGGTGYENLTTTTGTVTAGQTYTLSVVMEGSEDVNYSTAWIDYDHNGSFDAYEEIPVGVSTTWGGPFTFTTPVSIPYTAVGGITNLRLKCEANNSQQDPISPCSGTNYNGHTIDYSLLIHAAPACAGAPTAGVAVSSASSACSNAPFTLDLSGNSQVSGGSYQWQSSPNNSSWTNLGPAQSHVPYVVAGQGTATYYRCVVTCVGSGQSRNSASVLVGQNPISACYCIPDAMDCSGNDEINHVMLGSVLSNTSACGNANGYSDYTASVPAATVTAGTGYPLSVTLGYEYSEKVSAWIDYDQNGSFDNSEYTYIGSPAGSGNFTASGNIYIPASATAGYTRMRVRNIYGNTLGSGDACVNPAGASERLLISTQSGETEDYLLYILPANCSSANLPPNMSVSASPATVCANGAVTLSITATIPNYTGFTYQWQSSPNGTGYTNIGSPVPNSSITVNPGQTTYYVCEILCNGSPAVNTGSVMVSINTPTVTMSASAYTVCPAEPVTLTAGGLVSYTWTSGSSITPTTIVTPTISTTYTVTGTATSGCTATGTIAIMVKPATAITGTISTGSAPVPGTAILYKYEPFFTKFDSVTSQAIAANGGYNFANVNYGTYIVKAVPTASTLQVTYGSSSINWKTATLINHACATPDIQNIDVVPLTILSVGPGSMSGRITEGQGYGQRPSSPLSPLAPGQPIKGVTVKGGKNPGGNMFAQTTTDANGSYTLSALPNNLPGEEYFILVDIAGLDTNGTYYRVISTGSNTYRNLDFIVDSARINPVQSVNITQLSLAEHKVRVYPNPTNNKLNVAYSLSASSKVSVELYDLVGQLTKVILPVSEQASGDHQCQASLADLGAGIYFVKLRIDGAESSVKVFVTN